MTHHKRSIFNSLIVFNINTVPDAASTITMTTSPRQTVLSLSVLLVTYTVHVPQITVLWAPPDVQDSATVKR